MDCYDRTTRVYYPHHSEWVVPRGPGATNLGLCCRCGEITSLSVCVQSAREGNSRSTDALVAAGLMTAPMYCVIVTTSRYGRGARTHEVASYATHEEAEMRARKESRPLTAEERDDGWRASSAVVVARPGRMTGAASGA